MRRRVMLISLVLAILVIFIPQTTVVAQPVGNTNIQGEVGETLFLAPPSNFAFESLTPGTDATSDPKTVFVTSNKAGWFLTIEASTGGGYMMRSDSRKLIGPLQVKGGDISSYALLTNKVILKNGNGMAGPNVPVEMYFQQHVDPNEEAGLYSITVTFTVASSLP